MLPKSFRHVRYQDVVYCNLQNNEDLKTWMRQYSKNTNTTWTVKKTLKNQIKYLSQKRYVCHQKLPVVQNKNKNCKNVKCPAQINIKIRVVSLFPEDIYVKDGLSAEIKFINQHSHLLNDLQKRLRSSPEVIEIYEGLFAKNLGISEAMSAYDLKITAQYGDISLLDSSIRPNYSRVTHWFENYRQNFESSPEEPVITKLWHKSANENNDDTVDSVNTIKCIVKSENVKIEYDGNEEQNIDDTIEIETHDVKNSLLKDYEIIRRPNPSLGHSALKEKAGVLKPEIDDVQHTLTSNTMVIDVSPNQYYDTFRSPSPSLGDSALNEETIVIKPEIPDLQHELRTNTMDNEVSSKKYLNSYEFECSLCGKILKNKLTLSQHMDVHSDLHNFCCNLCGKAFKTKRYLSQHMSFHSETSDFKCNLCGRVLKHKGNLTRHMYLHTIESCNFECQQCGKAFKTKSYLSQHMKYHVDCYFECDKCGESFKSEDKLSQHMDTHVNTYNFNCSICGKAFKTKGYLTQHMKFHSDSRDFKCEKCGKAFKEKAKLQRHMYVHSEFSTFNCIQCGKTFKSKYYMNQHLKKH